MRLALILALAACKGAPPPDDGLPPPPVDGATLPVPDATPLPPDAASPDAADDGCASPPTGDWTGTTRFYEESGSSHELTATVRWSLAESAACIDHYVPSGSAHHAFSSLCDSVFDPAAWPIAASDGELVVDRSVAPATYQMSGTTFWDAVETCDGGAPEPVHIGGIWASAFGAFDGRVLAGNVTRDGGVLYIREWHFTPAGVTFPSPGSDCVEPATEHWTFTGQIGGVVADVAWDRASTDGCIDHFTPSGTARVSPFGTPECVLVSQDPAAATIAASDGALTIDRSANPPTYRVDGATAWPSDVTCMHADGTSETTSTTIGGPWASFRGEYEGDRFAGGAMIHDWRFEWSFARPFD